MTGVINNNVANNVIHENQPPVFNNPQGNPNHDVIQANPDLPLIEGLDIIEEEDAAANLPVEVAAKYERISRLMEENRPLSVSRLIDLVSDFSEKESGGQRVLFSSSERAQYMDSFLNGKMKELISSIFFDGHPDDAGRALLNPLNDVLDRIMCPERYDRAEADKAVKKHQDLDRCIELMGELAGDDTDKKSALAELRTFYSRVIDNQVRLFAGLRESKSLKKPVTIGKPADAMGIGKLLPSDKESFRKLFAAPRVSEKFVRSEVLSGNMTMEEALRKYPEYESILTDLSHDILDTLKESRGLQVPGDELNNIAGRDEITGADAGTLFSGIMRNLRAVAKATVKADTMLSPADRAAFAGIFEHDADPGNPNVRGRIFRENLLCLRNSFGRTDVFRMDGEGQPLDAAALQGKRELFGSVMDRLMAHQDQCMKILSAIDYSEDIFREMLREPEILGACLDIAGGEASGPDLRRALERLSSGLHNPVFRGDDSLVQSLLKAVTPQVYSTPERARDRIILEHYPITLDLTQDALNCIRRVIGDQNKTAIQMTMDDFRDAYQAICHPSDDLRNFVRGLGDHNDLRNQESIILRAAFHRYLVENAEQVAIQSLDNIKIEFSKSHDFLRSMGIVSEGVPQQDQVSISRYHGFDPTVANVKDTGAGMFIGVFNTMMNNASFLKAAAKLPEVHLTRKMSEALNVDIERLLNENPDLRHSYDKAVREKTGVLNWFRDHIVVLARAFAEGCKTEVREMEQENSDNIRRIQNTVSSSGISKIISWRKLMDPATPANNLTPEGILREAAAARGSTRLSALVTVLAGICPPPGINELIPEGQNYHGLTVADFRNPARVDAIRDVLNAVPDKNTTEFREIYMHYARLRVYCTRNPENQNPVSEATLAGLRITGHDLDFIENEQGPLNADPDGFERIGDLPLTAFCRRRAASAAPDRMAEMLSSLRITEDLFTPEHNIFVKDKKTGKAKYEAVKKAIRDAISALRRPNPDTAGTLRTLFDTVKDQLAGARTRELVEAVMNFTPYLNAEFRGAEEKPVSETFADSVKELFSSGYAKGRNTLLSGIISDTVALHAQKAAELKEGLTLLKATDMSQISRLDSIFRNNVFGSLMMSSAVHKVAYDNGYQSLADMKFDIIRGRKTSGGKTSADLVNEAVAYLKTRFRDGNRALFNDEALRKTVQSYLSLDSNSDNAGNSIHTARIRYAFRAIKKSSPVRMIKGFFSAIPGVSRLGQYFKNRNQLVKGRDYAESILNSIPPGQTLTHTHDNRLSGGFGINIDFKASMLKAEAGLALDANSDFRVSHTADGKYVFTMGAAFDATLKLDGAVKVAKTEVVSLGADAGGGYKKVYVLTFDDRKKAAEFLARAATGNLTRDIFRESSGQSVRMTGNVHGGIHTKGDVLGVYQDMRNQEVTSVREPANAQISGEMKGSYTSTYERGVDYHRHSRHKYGTVSLGAKVTFSLQQTLLGNKDPAQMTADEKKKYDETNANLTLGDIIVSSLMNQEKAVGDYVIGKYLTSEFNTNPDYAGKAGKKKWLALDNRTRYREDPNRYIAECIADVCKKNAVNPLIKDADALADEVLKGIPLYDYPKDFAKKLKNFLGTRGHSARIRTNMGIKFGDSTNNLVQAEAGISCTTDNEVRYDTNLTENRIRRADRITRITAESSGSAAEQMQKNLEFLKESMRELGCSGDEISKAMARLHNMQSRGIRISGFEINRTAKKDAILGINRSLAGMNNPSGKFESAVDRLREQDFRLDSIVFKVSKAHYSATDSFGVSFIASLEHTVTNSQSMIKDQTLKF